MLVSPQQLLADAKRGHYAVGAFNFYNLDTLFATIEAAEEEKSPAILQLYTADFAVQGRSVMAAATLEAIRKSPVPLALHLDHASSYEFIVQAIVSGFNSVMIDASNLPLEENIALTKKVVELAHHAGVYTEAELGPIFRIGEEKDPAKDKLADVDECFRLVTESGVDSLAPAIGTAHGIYTSEPRIDFERLEKIAGRVSVPLVLHGGSGIPDQMFRRAIAIGILKINYGTMLKHTWSKTMKEKLDQGELEIRKMIPFAREAVKSIVKTQLQLFGSSNKA